MAESQPLFLFPEEEQMYEQVSQLFGKDCQKIKDNLLHKLYEDEKLRDTLQEGEEGLMIEAKERMVGNTNPNFNIQNEMKEYMVTRN